MKFINPQTVVHGLIYVLFGASIGIFYDQLKGVIVHDREQDISIMVLQDEHGIEEPEKDGIVTRVWKRIF